MSGRRRILFSPIFVYEIGQCDRSGMPVSHFCLIYTRGPDDFSFKEAGSIGCWETCWHSQSWHSCSEHDATLGGVRTYLAIRPITRLPFHSTGYRYSGSCCHSDCNRNYGYRYSEYAYYSPTPHCPVTEHLPNLATLHDHEPPFCHRSTAEHSYFIRVTRSCWKLCPGKRVCCKISFSRDVHYGKIK